MLISYLRRASIGYIYFTMIKSRYGWNQLGIEARFIIDDYGNLVPFDADPINAD